MSGSYDEAGHIKALETRNRWLQARNKELSQLLEKEKQSRANAYTKYIKLSIEVHDLISAMTEELEVDDEI